MSPWQRQPFHLAESDKEIFETHSDFVASTCYHCSHPTVD